MSRPNKPRTVGAETRLAERITTERTARGWTYEDLANAMADAGCPIQPSAIYKIEKGKPQRRAINVDELVALSDVWAIPIERLLR